MIENVIYWQGIAVGIDCGDYISWFPSAPKEAISELTHKDKKMSDFDGINNPPERWANISQRITTTRTKDGAGISGNI